VVSYGKKNEALIIKPWDLAVPHHFQTTKGALRLLITRILATEVQDNFLSKI
jgi:hypothetical protein